MKEWFAQLDQREQMSVLALGVVLVLYLLYMLVWAPLDEKRPTAAARSRCGWKTRHSTTF